MTRVAAKRLGCVVCGGAFNATRADAKTCSDRCRRRLARRLAKAEMGQRMSQIDGNNNGAADRLTADVVRRHLDAEDDYDRCVLAASASNVCPGCGALDKPSGDYFCGGCTRRLPSYLRDLKHRGWRGLAEGLAEAFAVLQPPTTLEELHAMEIELTDPGEVETEPPPLAAAVGAAAGNER
jgi:predicted nucleic acid-binding Zn ribbon protein